MIYTSWQLHLWSLQDYHLWNTSAQKVYKVKSDFITCHGGGGEYRSNNNPFSHFFWKKKLLFPIGLGARPPSPPYMPPNSFSTLLHWARGFCHISIVPLSQQMDIGITLQNWIPWEASSHGLHGATLTLFLAQVTPDEHSYSILITFTHL